MRQVQREPMLNDAMPDHSGVGGGHYTQNDDEDFYAGSGSGSGFFTPRNNNSKLFSFFVHSVSFSLVRFCTK